jgi:hypothetical protein
MMTVHVVLPKTDRIDVSIRRQRDVPSEFFSKEE